ncbi:hypothetical protein [Alteribacillus iranensis]|uniref:Uncharacterized protein n=1 Tax=Alteribacillus iranensis TaxID=930128 RepID=A0A1I2D5R6_9BACI|nr:hypothetical protein [Alteribacillus iranensis]SFE75320.1 hypothetical protein SAMN05192532_103399 [Alteribacillus iranensis]
MSKIKRTIDKEYFRKAYLFGIFLAIVALLIFYLSKDTNYVPLIIVSFVLYPFARIPYDLLLGFRVRQWIEQESVISLFLNQLHYIIHFVIFLFSFFLAPLGILLLVIRTIYRWLRKTT